MKPRILLDCDGVVADFCGATCAHLTEITGTRHRPEDVRQFNMFDGLEPVVRSEIVRRIMSPGFCASLPVYDGAVDGVRKLAEHADIVWVTSPWSSVTWAGERMAWLEERFGGIGRNVLVTKPSAMKAFVAGDIFVDDQTKTVLEWTASNRNGVGVVWSQPYNENPQIGGHTVYRTSSWQTLANIAQNLAEFVR